MVLPSSVPQNHKGRQKDERPEGHTEQGGHKPRVFKSIFQRNCRINPQSPAVSSSPLFIIAYKNDAHDSRYSCEGGAEPWRIQMENLIRQVAVEKELPRNRIVIFDRHGSEISPQYGVSSPLPEDFPLACYLAIENLETQMLPGGSLPTAGKLPESITSKPLQKITKNVGKFKTIRGETETPENKLKKLRKSTKTHSKTIKTRASFLI